MILAPIPDSIEHFELYWSDFGPDPSPDVTFITRRYYKVIRRDLDFAGAIRSIFLSRHRGDKLYQGRHYRRSLLWALAGPTPLEAHIWASLPQDSAYKYYFSVMVTFAHSATRANGPGLVFLSRFASGYFFSPAAKNIQFDLLRS